MILVGIFDVFILSFWGFKSINRNKYDNFFLSLNVIILMQNMTNFYLIIKIIILHIFRFDLEIL